MKLLEDRILRDGQVRPGNVLKVDCFLNHQLDVDLLDKIGEEFYRIFKDDGVNKILTIEASGIAIACMTARHFDVPVVFAKKAKSKNIDGDVYTSTVHSYTYGKDYNITLAQKFLGPNDRVLILDDFLANGKAMRGLLDVCQQAGASVAGIGICIEKGFQPGGGELRREGYKLASLAIVDNFLYNGTLKGFGNALSYYGQNDLRSEIENKGVEDLVRLLKWNHFPGAITPELREVLRFFMCGITRYFEKYYLDSKTIQVDWLYTFWINCVPAYLAEYLVKEPE